MQSLQRLQPACTNVNTFASRPNHAALTPRCKPLKATHTETEGDCANKCYKSRCAKQPGGLVIQTASKSMHWSTIFSVCDSLA
eukprot:1142409-Pelagomonas_calceolata.AAC.2